VKIVKKRKIINILLSVLLTVALLGGGLITGLNPGYADDVEHQ